MKEVYLKPVVETEVAFEANTAGISYGDGSSQGPNKYISK